MLSPRLNVVPWLPPLLPPPRSYFLLLSTLCTADFKPSLLLRLLPLPLPMFTILRSFSSSIHRSHPGRVFDAVSSAPRTVHSFLKVQLSVDFSSVDVLVGRRRRRDSPERTSRYPFFARRSWDEHSWLNATCVLAEIATYHPEKLRSFAD